jgi:hypothetical protein
MNPKTAIKNLLSELPFTAETYWYLRQPGKPLNTSFVLHKLDEGMPAFRAQAAEFARKSEPGKRVLIFGALHYWISHAAVMGLALAGLGHRVSLAFLPYSRWQDSINRFDLRRQNVYARSVLRKANPLLRAVSFLGNGKHQVVLPADLEQVLRLISYRDTQYTLQVEDVSEESSLYHLRLERNFEAARSAFAWLSQNRPEVVIIPNGTILEFGVIYATAQHLGIPVVTYEFGEQRQRIWLAQNAEVMRQKTDELWSARGGRGLNPMQMEDLRALLGARQRGGLWQNFNRRWQGVPSAGGEQARSALGLDSRPVVLLATNVIGDSLTLGRQVFSDSMTEWLVRTVEYFARRPQVQLVVRVHPGELVTKGPSVAEVVKKAMPQLPEHIHLVQASEDINTYDLVEIAELGLVYTTTVGLEMAMSGVPVIVAGNTHYRGKGFTLDPDTWETYFELLEPVTDSPRSFQPSTAQVENAWEYAYRFFFEYPHPFPWHLVTMWEDLDEWPLDRVLGRDGQLYFVDTFRYLVGEPLDWSQEKFSRTVG